MELRKSDRVVLVWNRVFSLDLMAHRLSGAVGRILVSDIFALHVNDFVELILGDFFFMRETQPLKFMYLQPRDRELTL